MLKRACHGVYHQMSQKHLRRYANEFAGRINIRDKDTNDQRSPCLCVLVGQRPMYTDLTAPTTGGLG